MSFTALRHDDYDFINVGNRYDFINVGNRIEAKSSIEGAIIIPGNQSLYVAVDEQSPFLTMKSLESKRLPIQQRTYALVLVTVLWEGIVSIGVSERCLFLLEWTY